MSSHAYLKAQYRLDEMMHPTGEPWKWWEVSLDGKTWHTLDGLPQWSMFNYYRRKECAPKVYKQPDGTVVLRSDDTCDDWDNSLSPSATVETWTKTLTDDPEEAAMLNDLVHHPYHYAGLGEIECIEVLEQLAANGHDFRILNAMKYLWRYRHKGGTESLEKAIWYIERVIEDLS